MTKSRRNFATSRIGDPAGNRLREPGYDLERLSRSGDTAERPDHLESKEWDQRPHYDFARCDPRGSVRGRERLTQDRRPTRGGL